MPPLRDAWAKVTTDMNANDPTQLVFVRIDYDQVMSVATAPMVAFSPDVSSTLAFDPTRRCSGQSDTEYAAYFGCR